MQREEDFDQDANKNLLFTRMVLLFVRPRGILRKGLLSQVLMD